MKQVIHKKLVIVINGKGGLGKDTLCESLRIDYRVTNISAITPIKEIENLQYKDTINNTEKKMKNLDVSLQI